MTTDVIYTSLVPPREVCVAKKKKGGDVMLQPNLHKGIFSLVPHPQSMGVPTVPH